MRGLEGALRVNNRSVCHVELLKQKCRFMAAHSVFLTVRKKKVRKSLPGHPTKCIGLDSPGKLESKGDRNTEPAQDRWALFSASFFVPLTERTTLSPPESQ
jgi:hypothetical protein